MLGGNLRPRTRASSPNHSGDSMPMHSRSISKDEELGKRDDDFKPKRSPTATSLVQPWRWRKRRLFAVFTVMILVYLFVRNIPTDLGPIDQRLGVSLRPGHIVAPSAPPLGPGKEPNGAPPRPVAARDEEEEKHYFDGPIKFYRLASSLHGISRTMGSRPNNRNVLFAVSSLQSAANLMPMACEMAKWDRNYAHMVFLGRDSLPVDEILQINGVDKASCAVIFHDGRGDFSEYSTERRAEVAVAGAMKHIHEFMHPQAIIMDDSASEDQFFTRALRRKASEIGRALIEIPSGRYEEFMWLTKLDSGSLSNWFKPIITVLIHAASETSGSLIRLLRSLEAADYAGLRIPKLVIDLPTEVSLPLSGYLRDLAWPPVNNPSPLQQSTLTLRHRIPSARLSTEQASVRFLEASYPANTGDEHMLILTPQAELSPLFLQYLHYAILEYKYSSFGSPESDALLGISLDVPSIFLNGSGDFVPPTVAEMNAAKYVADYDQADAAPFLYQAPSATASLIFGDKWATLHNFLTHRLSSSHQGKAEKTRKLVSETEPSWLEFLLELMRARGWSMLHPSIAFATIHNELAQIPEEYLHEKVEQPKAATIIAEHPEEEPYLVAPDSPVLNDHIEREPDETQPLHSMLPFDADLPELSHLPLMAYTGNLINSTVASARRDGYVPVFRRQIGGCDGQDARRERVIRDLTADDLFCLPGVDLAFDGEGGLGADLAHSVIAETGGGTTADEDEVDDADVDTPP